MKRSWKSILGELAIWAFVSIATAVILILVADKILPANF
jgi:hypothetical protein